MSDSLAELTKLILAFRDAREWSSFHTPRHLSAALAIEAAEIQQLFLWKRDDEVAAFLADPDHAQELRHEIADVVIYALLLANSEQIDVATAIREKLDLNAERYPVSRARGNARKYTEFNPDGADESA